jgi:hypothetical protein
MPTVCPRSKALGSSVEEVLTFGKSRPKIGPVAARRPKDFKKLRLFMTWVVYWAINGFDNLINKLLLQK